ncbi:DUF6599 family protein [Candidatus Zixiibacteriota bacterium]
MMDRSTRLSLPLAVMLFVGCSGQNTGFPVVDGWERSSEVLVYDTDNLWEYINGAAELFIDYGVKTCHAADLASGDVTVTVEVYDMGTPLNAFGIFSLESSGRGEPFPNAIKAVISPPYQVLLLKGADYIKVNLFEGELTNAVSHSLLEGIASALRGSTNLPAEFDLLPENGRVSGSEGYQAQGFLGLTELTNCVHAEYAGEGDSPWRGFLVHALPATENLWTDLSESWESLQHKDATLLYREIPYRGLVGVVQTDRGIVGISGAVDHAQLVQRLDRFVY